MKGCGRLILTDWAAKMEHQCRKRLRMLLGTHVGTGRGCLLAPVVEHAEGVTWHPVPEQAEDVTWHHPLAVWVKCDASWCCQLANSLWGALHHLQAEGDW
ncbi:hypothetical protein J6590_016687 [Homalodisca vitripennis]|nr:hypothetical protein J6590_016687 [Homalodisca vitripennis]